MELRQGWGGAGVTSRSPLVMDSSSTRNCKSSTFLQGETGLSGPDSERWAAPQGGQGGARPPASAQAQGRHRPRVTVIGAEPPGNLQPSQGPARALL